MQTILKWLRGLGTFGSLVADFVALLATNWRLTMTAVAGLATYASNWLTALVNQPNVQAAALVFMVVLWSVVAVTYLTAVGRPIVTKAHNDVSYSLTFEGLHHNYNFASTDGLLQIGIAMRNYGPNPLQYSVSAFDVQISDRTLPRFKTGSLHGYLPRGAGRLSSHLPFKRTSLQEMFDQPVDGTIHCAIDYGHVEGALTRRLLVDLNIKMYVRGDKETIELAHNIVRESDEPIVKI